MTRVAEPWAAYVAELERADAASARLAPAWLARARRQASARFQSLGFPTTDNEEWRFTSVAPIAETRFEPAADGRAALAREALAPFRLGDATSAELVFVNGRYAPDLSRLRALPPGVRVGSLASALANGAGDLEPYLTRVARFERQPFAALNTAMFTDGALVQVPAAVALDAPIHALFVSAPGDRPTMAHPRLLAVVGEGGHASIVESYVGPAGEDYLTNAVTEIVVGDNASVDHYKLQSESLRGYHVGTLQVVGRRNARFQSHSVSAGGSLVRNDVVVVLDGEGVDCTLNGLYLCDAQRLVVNHTTIDHAKPHGSSRETYKGILADRARAVFNGRIVVRPDAQKTDAKQTNRALLLSEDAQINTTPQLEIFANDVKCTHGAAVGQMDDEAIFYLRSRGLSHEEARILLIQAFAGDVLNRMPLEALRRRVEGTLLQWLPHAMATS